MRILPDADGGKLHDEWESGNGLDLADPGDAELDSDSDGLKNSDEYLAGTDPRDAASYLKVGRVTFGDRVSIEFMAASNKAYTVEYTNQLSSGIWNKLADVVPRVQSGLESFQDLAPTDSRCYRLLTPRED